MSDDETPTGPERTTPYEGAHANPDHGDRFGRFLLREVLGEGSFGRVYRAYDPTLDREVALKVPTFPMDRPDLAERFVREARAAARLRHPNIVAVFETNQVDGQLYIASEFVNGRTLHDTVKAERPSLRRAVEWVRTLALALHYANEEGVVHRDVKPSNIMIDSKGRPQLMDFGLAKRAEADGPVPLAGDADDPTRTAAGTVLGTPGYMSPEQARGELDKVGPHSDQYSLGVVLYELLTGRRPFTGRFHELRFRVGDPTIAAESPRKYDRGVPPELADVCLKAIHKQPHRRYATLAAFAVDLQRWLNGEPISAHGVPRVKWQGWAGRLRDLEPATIRHALAVFVLLLVAGVYAYVYWPSRAAAPQEPPPAAARSEDHSTKAELYRERGLRLRAEGKPAEGLLWLAHAYSLTDGAKRRAIRADFTRAAAPAAPEQLDADSRRLWRLIGLCLLGIPLPDEDHRAPLVQRLEQGGAPALTGFAVDRVLTADNFAEKPGRWKLRDAASGQLFGPEWLPGDKVHYSPDGTRAVVASSVWTVLDLRSGEALGPRHEKDCPLLGLAFSPDGSRLAVCREGTSQDPAPVVEIWDLESVRKLSSRFQLQGFDGRRVRDLMLAPDGGAIFAHGGLLRPGEVLKPASQRAAALAFHPDGDALFVRDASEVRLVGLDDTPRKFTLPVNPKEFVVSRDGRLALTLSAEGAARLWDLDAQAEILYPFDPSRKPQRVAFRHDARAVLTAEPNDVRLWPVPRTIDPAAAVVLWAELAAYGTLPLGLFANGDLSVSAFATGEFEERWRRLRKLVGSP